MDYITLLGIVLVSHFVALISPGPDFFIVTKNAITKSRKDGICTAIGVGLGIGIHVIYCVAGLAVIISQSIVVFSIIKVIAGLYLIWIGFKSIKSSFGSQSHVNTVSKISKSQFKQSFMDGFLTNCLNPKATLFLLSLFTIIIPKETPIWFLLLAGCMLIIMTMLFFTVLAYVITISKINNWFNSNKHILDRLFGGILIALGLKFILSKN